MRISPHLNSIKTIPRNTVVCILIIRRCFQVHMVTLRLMFADCGLFCNDANLQSLLIILQRYVFIPPVANQLVRFCSKVNNADSGQLLSIDLNPFFTFQGSVPQKKKWNASRITSLSVYLFAYTARTFSQKYSNHFLSKVQTDIKSSNVRTLLENYLESNLAFKKTFVIISTYSLKAP